MLLRRTRVLFAESNRRRKHLNRVTYDDETNPLAKITRVDKGTLYLVPTPIGNLKDFSLRGLETLRQVDYIVCINKVASQVLLDLIDINFSGRLIQYNKHFKSHHRLAEMVKGGASAALICNQGVPVVGDQGGDVVSTFLSQGVRVSALPGPCALVSALAMSGTSGAEDAFFFGGHLSQQRGARMKQLREACVINRKRPAVFYEATPRLRFVLEELAVLCPDRIVSVVHEISKIHEATHRDTAERLRLFYSRAANRSVEQKGQITIIVDADKNPDKEKVSSNGEGGELAKKLNEDANSIVHLSTSLSPSVSSSSSSAVSPFFFREKVLCRLVEEKLASLSSSSQKNQKEHHQNLKAAVLFVSEQMKVSRIDVLAAIKKHGVRDLRNSVAHSSETTTKTEKEEELQASQEEEEEEEEEKEVQKQERQRPKLESRQSGNLHVPDDWIAVEEKIEEQTHADSSSSSSSVELLDNNSEQQQQEVKKKPTTKEDKKKRRAQVRKAKMKLLSAIRTQKLKTKFANDLLNEELQEEEDK